MGDEPPYLSVGTEVSAKYKGAFCEAKIRKVVRSVKCKVLFKQGLGSHTVTDDYIKGSLKHGAIVEARHPDKKEFVEATISKVQDCSQYTVVFDDGDITTLRRTAICLKSGRHFAESETLDQLPLTHPEHFSNPVIGGKRGRRRTGLDENSDDEESYTHLKDFCDEKEEDIGRVICVEGEKKKHNKDVWFPALVVAPTAQDTVPIDIRLEYLVRSFKDGRYYTVPKKEAMEFTREMGAKVENSTSKTAVEKALLFLDKDELPPHWDRDSLFGLNESLVTDSDGANDAETSDDETREEKDHFVAQLYKFMDDSGTPINKAPLILAQDLDLYRLFKVVQNMGGFNRVSNHNNWKTVSHKMGFGQNPATVALVKQSYKKFLFSFEDFYRKLGCTMVSHPRTSRNRSTRSLIRDKDKVVKNEMKPPSKEKVEASPEYPLIPSPVPPIKWDTTDDDQQSETIPTPKLFSKEKTGIRKLPEPSVIESPSPVPEEPPPPVPVEEVNTEAKEIKKTRLKKSKIEKIEQTMKTIEEREEGSVLKETKRRLFTRSKRDKEKGTLKTMVTPTITRQKRTFKEKIKGLVGQLKLKTSKYAISALGLQDTSEKIVHPKKIKDESVVQKMKKEEAPPAISSGSEEKRKGRKRKEKSEIIDDRFDTLPTYKTVSVGDKLKVYYGPKHDLKVTYEAKVLDIREEGNETLYLVHYYGWNTRYDEWIKHSRVADNMSWVPGRPSRKSLQVHKNARRKNAALKSENEDSVKMEADSMDGEPPTSSLVGASRQDSPESPHYLTMRPKGTRTSTRAFSSKRIYENDAESESENNEFSTFSRAKSCDFTETKISLIEKRARKRKSSEGDSSEIRSSCKSEKAFVLNKKMRKLLVPGYLSDKLKSSADKCEETKNFFSKNEENSGNKEFVSEVQFKNKSPSKALSKEDISSTQVDKNIVGVTAEKKFRKEPVIHESEIKKKLQTMQRIKKEDTLSQFMEMSIFEKPAKTINEISNISESVVEMKRLKDVSKISECDEKIVQTEQKTNENVSEPKQLESALKKNILISPSDKLQFSLETKIKKEIQSADKNKTEQKLIKESMNLPVEKIVEHKTRKGTNVAIFDGDNQLNPVVEKKFGELVDIFQCAIPELKTNQDQKGIEDISSVSSQIEKEIPNIELKSKNEICTLPIDVYDSIPKKDGINIPVSENIDVVEETTRKDVSSVSVATEYKSVSTVQKVVANISESLSIKEQKLEGGVSSDKKSRASAAELKDTIEVSNETNVQNTRKIYSQEEKSKDEISEMFCDKRKSCESKLKKGKLSAECVKKSGKSPYKKDMLNLSASGNKDKYLSLDRKFKVEGIETFDSDSKKFLPAKQKIQDIFDIENKSTLSEIQQNVEDGFSNDDKRTSQAKPKIQDNFDTDLNTLSETKQKVQDALDSNSKVKSQPSKQTDSFDTDLNSLSQAKQKVQDVFDSKGKSQHAKQKVQDSFDTDLNILSQAKQKVQDSFDSDLYTLSQVEQKVQNSLDTDLNTLSQAKHKVQDNFDNDLSTLSQVKQKVQDNLDTDFNVLPQAKLKTEDSLGNKSKGKLSQVAKQKVQDSFDTDLNTLSQVKQKFQDTLESSSKGKLAQAARQKALQDTFDCDSKNKLAEITEQKVQGTFDNDGRNKTPDTAKQKIQDTIECDNPSNEKVLQASKQMVLENLVSDGKCKSSEGSKVKVQDISPVPDCENKSISESKNVVSSMTECSANITPKIQSDLSDGNKNKLPSIRSMVRKIVGSEDSLSGDEENTQNTVLTKKQLIDLNKKMINNDKENPPKGCDFDLNQIRSELKGIDTAVCSGSPSDGSEDEGDDEEEDEENDEAECDEENEYPDIENVSIETVKEEVDDIYEFKEPEPFEFEARKIVDDKNILQRRSLRGFNFDEKTNVDCVSPSFKSKPYEDTKTISDSDFVGIHTCEEAFDKICASPLRAATEASSVFDDQYVNDTPDDDSQDRLIISERYSDNESNMSVCTQKEVQEKEVKVNLSETVEKVSERIDYFRKGGKDPDIEKVEMEIKENFIKEEWKDDVEDEALNVAIQRAINQELSDEKDEILENKPDSVNKFEINEPKIVICGELGASSFEVHKDSSFSYQFSFLKQTSEVQNENSSLAETIEENVETDVEVSSDIVSVSSDLKNSKEILLEDKAVVMVTEEIVNEDVEDEIEVVDAVDIEIKESDQESKILLTDGSVSEKVVFSLEPEEGDDEEDTEVDVGNGVEDEVIVEDVEEEEEEENLISLICNEEIIPSSPTPQVDLQEEEKNLVISRGSDVPTLNDEVKKGTGHDSCLDENELHDRKCSQIDTRLHSISSDTSTISAPQAEDTSHDLTLLQTVKTENSSKQKSHTEADKKHRADTRSSKKPAVKKGKRPRKRSQDVGKRKYSRNRHGSDSDEFYESRTHSGRSESHRHSRNSKFHLTLKLDPDLDSNGRIAAIQNSIQQLRTAYAEAKAELAVIDRRRKKLRRREREKNAHR